MADGASRGNVPSTVSAFILRLLSQPNEASTRRLLRAAYILTNTDDLAEGVSNLYFTNERVDDRVAALLVPGTNITSIVYNDAAGTLTINAAGGGGGGIVRTVTSIAVNTAAGAAALTDYVYIATAGGITLTLPTAVGNTNRYTYKNSAASNVSLASTGGQTFDGTASPIVLSPGQSLDLISNGANWTIH